MIAKDIFNALKQIFNNKVFPDILPEGESISGVPFCVYSLLDTPNNDICNSFSNFTVQIDIYANTDIARHELFESVKNALFSIGFYYTQNRNSFESEFMLYRSSSDWRK